LALFGIYLLVTTFLKVPTGKLKQKINSKEGKAKGKKGLIKFSKPKKSFG